MKASERQHLSFLCRFTQLLLVVAEFFCFFTWLMCKCSKQKMLFLICLFLFLKEWPSLTSLRPSKTKWISKMKLNKKRYWWRKIKRKRRTMNRKKNKPKWTKRRKDSNRKWVKKDKMTIDESLQIILPFTAPTLNQTFLQNISSLSRWVHLGLLDCPSFPSKVYSDHRLLLVRIHLDTSKLRCVVTWNSRRPSWKGRNSRASWYLKAGIDDGFGTTSKRLLGLLQSILVANFT